MVGKPQKKSSLMLVPESILKKRHDLDDLARKRAAASEQQQQHGSAKPTATKSTKKAFYVKKPETFLVRGRSRRNNAARYRRVQQKGMQKRASNQPNMVVQEIKELDDDNNEAALQRSYQSNSVGAAMVFCIRIRDHVGVPKVVEKILQQMRLTRIHQGVFLRYTAETRQSLHLVEPFVVYGSPSKAVVTDLLERKGHGLVNGERVPLSDNTVIETALGEKHSIICIEDLVHELYTAGPSFHAAAEFLSPFSLADTKTEFERQTLKLKDGKDYGDRGQAINEYIQQIL